MYLGSVLGLIAALAAAPAFAAPRAVEVGLYVWQEGMADFGGLSAIELSPDGAAFVAVSDRSAIFSGHFMRGDKGQVTAVTLAPDMPVLPRTGTGGPVTGEAVDSEGVALLPDGDFYVSYETVDRIVEYGDAGRTWLSEDRAEAFSHFNLNAGIEALAIDAKGRLWAMPEGGPAETKIPVYRREGDRWTRPILLRRDGNWRAVGADFGPDGRLYLLERDYWPLLGFMNRIRRIAFDGDRVAEDLVLMQSEAGTYDNLEGLAVWQDGQGAIRLTAVSDDNFLPTQRTELVDFRVTE